MQRVDRKVRVETIIVELVGGDETLHLRRLVGHLRGHVGESHHRRLVAGELEQARRAAPAGRRSSRRCAPRARVPPYGQDRRSGCRNRTGTRSPWSSSRAFPLGSRARLASLVASAEPLEILDQRRALLGVGHRPTASGEIVCHVRRIGGAGDHRGDCRVAEQILQEHLTPARRADLGGNGRQRLAP